MSDRMRLIPFENMVEWVLAENRRDNAIFGIKAGKFYKKGSDKNLFLFGKIIENPIGPAAGPHTQLAQNIIAAYLTGSRFFELKTVQTLDGEDLPVSKPCILADDEGYNVEWSTELTVQDAFNEYIKAYFILHILAEELGLGIAGGFAFNMSVGYDLEGIKSPKIDAFIEGLKDASQTNIWNECKTYLLDHIGMFKKVDADYVNEISPKVCASITLSTLHGCPPQEIEKIANYLLGVKKLHTFVKCNPTLLGYETARDILDSMGYHYLSFDDHHFNNDLQFSDAVPMITRLQNYSKSVGLEFGVKLTNTFPVKIMNDELPGEQMYMSGRALYPLTITLAYKMAKAFNGDLRISYSGGADYFNIHQIYKTGIWPITLATTLLKPGGYLRLGQLAELMDKEYTKSGFGGIDVALLKELSEDAIQNPYYQKEWRGTHNRKIKKQVPLTDCYIAPCKEGCPIGQDIPEYIRLLEEGKYKEALEVIVAKNPLPHITGTLCPHQCMSKCTRIDYDQPVDIRSAKLTAALNGYDALINSDIKPSQKSDIKVAVIGAGPTGLSAGYFLARNGIDVTVFDKRNDIGGIVAHVIPDFRIADDLISRDMALIKKMGVKFVLGVGENFSIQALKEQGYQYIFVAIGAWRPGNLHLESCDKQMLNVLDFLEKYKQSRETLNIGKDVAVIGGGNAAMDAARAAKRVHGVDNAYIVYRRTKEYMPADKEELDSALEDGVIFKELLSPVSFEEGILKCQKMKLGAPDVSGRRRPLPLPGEYMNIKTDCVIAAVGEKVDSEWLAQNGIERDEKGKISVDPQTNETRIDNVFIGGDALRGPGSIVEGIADGMKFAESVLGKEIGHVNRLGIDERSQEAEITDKKGVLLKTEQHESAGCLECNYICNVCTEVCPNRANVVIRMNDGKYQIVHVDGMCNECGNCAAFCPYSSAPYKDKLTLYWNSADFEDSTNAGFLATGRSAFRVRLGADITDVSFDGLGKCTGDIPDEIADIIWMVDTEYGYLLRNNKRG